MCFGSLALFVESDAAVIPWSAVRTSVGCGLQCLNTSAPLLGPLLLLLLLLRLVEELC